MKTQLKTLFKYDNKQKLRQWTVFVEDNTFSIETGIVGGKLTKSKPTKCSPKNVGTKSETTSEQQALKEAESLYKKKIKSGYYENVEDIVFNNESPMLAETFDNYKNLLFKYRTFISPKLDGVRCIDTNNIFLSRNNTEIVSIPHIEHSNLGVYLDGELYNHDLKEEFEKITGLVNKTSLNDEKLALTKQYLQYHVYDCFLEDKVFSERYEWIQQNVKETEYIKLVPAYEVFSMEDINLKHKEFTNLGYEGSMIRLDIGGYERNKRSKQLLKLKDFKDDEFEIVGYIEGKGNRSGTIGKFILKIDDNKTFECNILGSMKYLTELFNNADEYIGQLATVKYKTFTNGGKPKQAIIKSIRNYEE